jgi:hypothetical protein
MDWDGLERKSIARRAVRKAKRDQVTLGLTDAQAVRRAKTIARRRIGEFNANRATTEANRNEGAPRQPGQTPTAYPH